MKRREYILALIAGAIVLVAVAQRLVLSPLRGAWQGLAARVSARRAALVSARELLKRADTLQARYRSSAAAVEGDPDTRQIAFLAFLQSAAGRAGVRVASEKPTLVWQGQGGRGAGAGGRVVRYGECTVSLNFTSSLEALVHFLTELAAGEEAVRVRSLQVAAQDPGGRSLKVTLRLSVVVLPSEAQRLASAETGRSPGAPQPPPGLRPLKGFGPQAGRTGALAVLGFGGAEWWGGAGAGSAKGPERGAAGTDEVRERAEAQP